MEKKETKETRSAGTVVLNPRGEILLVIHNTTRAISLPKGHLNGTGAALEGDEDAAKRELREEAGIRTDDETFCILTRLGEYSRYKLGKKGDDDTREMKTIILFLCRTDQEEFGEHEPQRDPFWIRKEFVATLLTHPKDKEFFQECLDKGLIP